MQRRGLAVAIVALAGIMWLFVPSFCAISAQDDDMERLQQKVRELERRTKQLEALLEECVGTRKQGIKSDYGWQNKKNWRRLEIGMSDVQVRAILGEPTKVIQGVRILWYYPNIYGGFVSFDRSGKLEGWNEP